MSSSAPVLRGPPMPPDLAEAAPPAANAADSAPGEDLERGLNSSELNLSTVFADPCLALFLADRDTPPQRLRALLAAAWAHDATTALKLICQLRAVRGDGKGDREGFYSAALWMHQCHPRTLAASANLSVFAELGYIKDLPEILYRVISGGDVRQVAKDRSEAKGFSFPQPPQAGRKRPRSDDDDDPAASAVSACDVSTEETGVEEPVDQAAPKELEAAPASTVPTKRRRKRKKPADVFRLAQLALNKYRNDENYRRLFDSIADFFADNLRADLDKHDKGDYSNIGLAAKWCPSVGSTIDQSTLLCEGIARRIFPRECRKHYTTLTEDQYVCQVLGRLRREVLVKLRNVLELPEVYMSKNRWHELPYHRVAKEAMRRYEPLFKKHDGARFHQYLEDVEAGKANKAGAHKPGMAAAGALLPHELLVLMAKEKTSMRVLSTEAHQQWLDIVHDLRTKKSLHNCLAICDLSPEGNHDPFLRSVCAALTLLTSEISENPWAGIIYKFKDVYQLFGSSLKDKLNLIYEKLAIEEKFDLTDVFQLVLSMGEHYQLKSKPEAMARTIFIFTDKNFHPACEKQWKADYKNLCSLFKKRGFRDAVPQVVVWNLAGPRSAALTKSKNGVMTLSGFSNDLMKLFLDNDGIVEPEDEMHASIAGQEYKKLVVINEG